MRRFMRRGNLRISRAAALQRCGDSCVVAIHASLQFEDMMGCGVAAMRRCSDAAIHVSWQFEDITGCCVAAMRRFSFGITNLCVPAI